MEGKPFFAKLRRDRVFWLIVVGLFAAYALLRVQGNLLFNLLAVGVTLISLLVAITIHECSHAWAADKLGDPTARLMGRVSFNPLVHLEPTGAVMMLITTLTGFGIGWGKPVPVNPYRLRYGVRRGNALVALAGPASNLLLATCLGLLVRLASALLPSLGTLYFLLSFIIQINIVIAMFNLLPIPPLDGHSVLLGLLSLSHSKWAWRVSEFIAGLARYGSMILIGLIFLSQFLNLRFLDYLIGVPSSFFYRIIMGSGG